MTTYPEASVPGGAAIVPTGVPSDGVWIPPAFSKEIEGHVRLNYLAPRYKPPLTLAIQGPPGVGKSFQAREVCSRLGYYVVPVMGAWLSGEHEAEARNELKKHYQYASSVHGEVGYPVVVLIDDIDLSDASTFEGYKYTVNSQILTGFLMGLHDDPTRLGGNSRTFRIPLVVTGNNLTALHGPLTRDGRVDFFDWEPSLHDRTRIVEAIYATTLQRSQLQVVRDLVQRYDLEPISFFAALHTDLVKEVMLNMSPIDNRGYDLPSLRHAVQDALQHELQRQGSAVLIRLAEERHKMGPKNFLNRQSAQASGTTSSVFMSDKYITDLATSLKEHARSRDLLRFAQGTDNMPSEGH